MSTCLNIHMDSKTSFKYVNFLKMLHEEVQKLQNGVNWSEVFREENSYDVIFSVVNEFVYDVNISIYNLHQIMIKIDKNQSSYSDLKVFVNKLRKSSFELQEAFGEDSSVLKSKLIIAMQNIIKDAQTFSSIVEKNKSPEFNIELVDSLSEILSNLEKVLIYNQLKQLTPKELEQIFNAGEQECRQIVATNHLQHETCVDKTILEGVSRQTFHGVIIAQRIAFRLHKTSSSYNEPIKEKINEAARNLNKVGMDITAALYEVTRGGEGTTPLDKCIVGGFQAFRGIMKLMDLVNLCDKRGKEPENLKNLVFYGLSSGLCLTKRFRRDMTMVVLERN